MNIKKGPESSPEGDKPRQVVEAPFKDVDGVIAAVNKEVAQMAQQLAEDPQAKETISARLKRMSEENAFGGKI